MLPAPSRLLLLGVLMGGVAAAEPGRDAVLSAPLHDPPRVERCGRVFPGLSTDEGAAGEVAVDGAGFVWVASARGLLRWDGERTRSFRVPGEAAPRRYTFIVARGDEVAAVSQDEDLVELDGDHLRLVRPEPRFRAASRPLFSEDGLRVVSWGADMDAPKRLSHRDRSGVWTHVELPPITGAIRTLDLEIDADGEGVLIATWDDGLWELHDDGRLEQRGTGTFYGLAALGPGRVAALHHPGLDHIDADGNLTSVRFGDASVGAHGHSRYVTTGDDLVHMVHGGHLDTVFPDGSVSCTRELTSRWHPVMAGAVDREGSLWLTTLDGVARFAAPATQSFTPDVGLSVHGVLDVFPGRDRTWMTHWNGTVSRLDREGSTWRHRRFDTQRLERICKGGGGVWATAVPWGDDRGWFRLESGEPVLHRKAAAASCRESAAGGVWLLEDDALFEVDANGVERGPFAHPSPTRDDRFKLHELAGGGLVALGREQVCTIDRADLRRGSAWRCDALPETLRRHQGGTATVDGALWVGSTDGIVTLDGARFRPVEGIGELGAFASVVSPSPRGGVWIKGADGLVRISHEGGSWAIVERVSERLGVRGHGGGLRLRESASGELWIESSCGWTVVPRSVRDRAPAPLRLRLTDVEVGGEQVADAPSALPYPLPPVTLRFATLTSAEPAEVVYRVRLDGGAWSEPTQDASVQLLSLAPGAHQVEISAARRGSGEPPVTLVLPVHAAFPWYQQTWFFGLVGLVATASLYGLYRIALAVQLRLARQRTAIAMDLHDELGAGLGSIRILASLVSDGTAPPERAQELTARIELMAVELGGALTDIVWSLRPTSSTLQALVVYLSERGRDLFASSDVTFRVIQPDVLPRRTLPLAVSRNSQLIVLEAMRNAARHARAGRVELRVQVAGGRVAIELADDGVGFEGTAGSTRTGGGTGMESMRTRAEAIGADLEVQSGTVGTRIRLVLPRGRPWG